MNLHCPALLSEKYIPNRFADKSTPGGHNMSLPLAWGDIPAGTKSFACSITDGSSLGRNAVHWLVVNIPGNMRSLSEDASRLKKLPPNSLELRNSFGDSGYRGPRSNHIPGHREFVVTVYALKEEKLRVGPFSAYQEFISEASGKILRTVTLTVFLP